MKAPELSVVIPVCNSASILPTLVERLGQVLSEHVVRYETILVNDGSRDGSWNVVCDLARKNSWLRGINLMRNYGQHNALLCGIREVKTSVTVTMDDDLQNPPEEIPKLLAKMAEGYDVVYGTPEKEQHGLLRNLASQITKMVLQRAMGAQTARHVSAFRIFRTRLRDAFRNYNGPYVSIDVLLTWGARTFAAIPVHHESRREGQSNYTVKKLVVHALNMVTGFSILPLQLASLIGFLFTIVGLGVLAFVVGIYLIHGSTVAGFPFLASIIAIFAGAQLFALGIIGEYLARMHFHMMDRPSYVVDEEARGAGTPELPGRGRP